MPTSEKEWNGRGREIHTNVFKEIHRKYVNKINQISYFHYHCQHRAESGSRRRRRRRSRGCSCRRK